MYILPIPFSLNDFLKTSSTKLLRKHSLTLSPTGKYFHFPLIFEGYFERNFEMYLLVSIDFDERSSIIHTISPMSFKVFILNLYFERFFFLA